MFAKELGLREISDGTHIAFQGPNSLCCHVMAKECDVPDAENALGRVNNEAELFES